MPSVSLGPVGAGSGEALGRLWETLGRETGSAPSWGNSVPAPSPFPPRNAHTAPQIPTPTTRAQSRTAAALTPSGLCRSPAFRPGRGLGEAAGAVMVRWWKDKAGFPESPSKKASMVGNRSSGCTAKAFRMACSTWGGRAAPSSEGAFSVSLWTRWMESGGSSPVTQRYRVAPMAYTSVQGPCFPLLEYCSSGA